jgi:hypothetical protein
MQQRAGIRELAGNAKSLLTGKQLAPADPSGVRDDPATVITRSSDACSWTWTNAVEMVCRFGYLGNYSRFLDGPSPKEHPSRGVCCR